MEMRQLRHFLAVIDHRHFGRAARSVRLTQQALSHSISTLEKALQAQLFERGKFGAEPTAIGRIFEKRARLICTEADFAAAEVMAFKGGGDGHISIGVSQNFASNMMPCAVKLFAKARPNVRLSVVVGTSKQLFDMIVAGRIELAVTSPIAGIDSHAELEHTAVKSAYLHDPSYIVVNPLHPLLDDPVLVFSELGRFPWCMPESWFAPWADIFNLMRISGADAPKYVVRTDSLSFAKALIIQSDFIGLLGHESVATEVEAGVLSTIALPVAAKSLPAYVSHRRNHTLQPATRPLIDCVERAMNMIKPRQDPSAGRALLNN